MVFGKNRQVWKKGPVGKKYGRPEKYGQESKILGVLGASLTIHQVTAQVRTEKYRLIGGEIWVYEEKYGSMEENMFKVGKIDRGRSIGRKQKISASGG